MHVGVCGGGVTAVPFKAIVEVLYVDYGNIGRVCVLGGLCGCVGVCV